MKYRGEKSYKKEPSLLSQCRFARPKSLVWVSNPHLRHLSVNLNLVISDGALNIECHREQVARYLWNICLVSNVCHNTLNGQLIRLVPWFYHSPSEPLDLLIPFSPLLPCTMVPLILWSPQSPHLTSLKIYVL